MATADLLVIVCEVILHRIADLSWMYSFLFHYTVCRSIIFLAPAAVACSVWLTVAFTFDRFVAISTQNLRTRYCTERTALVVIVTLTAFFCLLNVPWPFAYNYYFRDQQGTQWGCLIRYQFYGQSSWIAFSWTQQLLVPVIPFCLIMLMNVLTVRRILVASRVRRKLRDLSNEDPEIANRRRSVILLLAISSSFMVLWGTNVVYFVFYRITNAFRARVLMNRFPTFEQTGILLQLLSTCTNTVIYTVAQRRFREHLLQVLMYPFTLTMRSVFSTISNSVPDAAKVKQSNCFIKLIEAFDVRDPGGRWYVPRSFTRCRAI
ncbi:probable G-protein coupled receptor 139 [Leucoraja erinacea]|uniref:probable G-protein coupled receptor 139 n=1 Tax=Leucoraja erinaceus TaxID=7782 RepID=UPI0024545A6A|nr:probable G-protein coupled receptor 139 [Leucoraja erinacea]